LTVRRTGEGEAVAGYSAPVIEIGSQMRTQPSPPHVVFEALTRPDRDPARKWLTLLDDECPPTVVSSTETASVTWTSLWAGRPDVRIRFDLAEDAGGTALRWTLSVDEPVPDDALIGHFRKRTNKLINSNLRRTFGQ
jgi:hypothetical protein